MGLRAMRVYLDQGCGPEASAVPWVQDEELE